MGDAHKVTRDLEARYDGQLERDLLILAAETEKCHPNIN